MARIFSGERHLLPAVPGPVERLIYRTTGVDPIREQGWKGYLGRCLPDHDGLTILQRLREWSTVPVVVLTVRDAESDKVAALDAGADEYVTKPFSTAEYATPGAFSRIATSCATCGG